ncbi:MAG: hypothetical protein ABI740_10050 [Alphaproteobacteria bacterium]
MGKGRSVDCGVSFIARPFSLIALPQSSANPQHFADIFHLAFPDPPTIAQLIDDAGRLRAASHYARDFTPDDLRDLRVVWRMLEAGLLALTEDIDFDGWH